VRFNKYHGRLPIARLEEVMMAIPFYLGKKFIYSKVNPTVQAGALKQSLDLLSKARVCHKVLSTAANGVPLGAEVHEGFLKVIFLDVGLCSAALGLSLSQLSKVEDIDLINKGVLLNRLLGSYYALLRPSMLSLHSITGIAQSQAQVLKLIMLYNTVIESFLWKSKLEVPEA
jgi:uncharacterized protein